MKQQDKLKRLHWTTDKEQILHIRTSSKVGQAIADTRELLQSLCLKDNEVVDGFNKHRAEVYANTKVECKYDDCVFDVSFKTLKDELKRRKNLSK